MQLYFAQRVLRKIRVAVQVVLHRRAVRAAVQSLVASYVTQETPLVLHRVQLIWVLYALD